MLFHVKTQKYQLELDIKKKRIFNAIVKDLEYLPTISTLITPN